VFGVGGQPNSRPQQEKFRAALLLQFSNQAIKIRCGERLQTRDGSHQFSLEARKFDEQSEATRFKPRSIRSILVQAPQRPADQEQRAAVVLAQLFKRLECQVRIKGLIGAEIGEADAKMWIPNAGPRPGSHLWSRAGMLICKQWSDVSHPGGSPAHP
jgi:hypothetical protein